MLYDSIIIGGGFAGLSAAIYLARYNRSVLVLDNSEGRWNSFEINQNYLGFPHGITSKALRTLGVEQAKVYGAHVAEDIVLEVKKQDDKFFCKGKDNTYQGKTLEL